jgi:HPt (histidine-containing phosphotransfer) domain-containing protein
MPHEETRPSPRITVCVDPDLEEIIPNFLANRHKDIHTLQSCGASKDFGTIAVLGHRMKGDGGGYGFDAISHIGAALELAAGRHDLPAIERLTTDLRDYLARIEVVFRSC